MAHLKLIPLLSNNRY